MKVDIDELFENWAKLYNYRLTKLPNGEYKAKTTWDAYVIWKAGFYCALVQPINTVKKPKP